MINASFNNVCWRDRYLYYELETHRAALTMKELEVLPPVAYRQPQFTWHLSPPVVCCSPPVLTNADSLQALQLHLNFTPTAGGRGIETLRPAFFSQDFLLLPGYPPLPCKLAGPSSAARSTTGASALPALAIAESAGALSADECPQENADGIQHLPPYIPPPNVDHLLRQLKQLILTPLHRSRATWLSVSSRDARQTRIFEPPQHQAALLHIADFPVHFVRRFLVLCVLVAYFHSHKYVPGSLCALVETNVLPASRKWSGSSTTTMSRSQVATRAS